MFVVLLATEPGESTSREVLCVWPCVKSLAGRANSEAKSVLARLCLTKSDESGIMICVTTDFSSRS